MPQGPIFSPERKLAHDRWRLWRDRLTRRVVALGGGTLLLAISLIFFYLLYVVVPLFLPASLSLGEVQPQTRSHAPSLHIALDSEAGMAVRYRADGVVEFFHSNSGELLADHPSGLTQVVTLAVASGEPELAALLGPSGELQLLRHRFERDYHSGSRLIHPELEPLAPTIALPPHTSDTPPTLALQADQQALLIALQAGDGSLRLWRLARGSSTLEPLATLNDLPLARFLRFSPDGKTLYLLDSLGRLLRFSLDASGQLTTSPSINLLDAGARLGAFELLAGGESLLVGDDRGTIVQWFEIRDTEGRSELIAVRRFQAGDTPIRAIVSERWRRVFATLNGAGELSLFHASAGRRLLHHPLPGATAGQLSLSARGDAALLERADGRLQRIAIDNPHPEISWQALWGEVQYEHYPAPAAVWQSSAASSSHEPKLSLTPLLFGTLKAALFAMLFAVPLALLGAVYTGYFMHPTMRRLVKPTIELLEALPTVILGLLAGLLLAPLIDSQLAGILLLFPTLPLVCLLAPLLWSRLPASLRQRIAPGWEAALLIPLLLLAIPSLMALGGQLEQWLVGGDLRGWLSREWGLGYNQRNALVIGLAMGLAVIPAIFSIAEDAIFNVPRHLTLGSLALGATRWDTLWRVVLLTASPGLFSAVMIGLGRAVGETMIVLMASGNTPVLDLSLFEGLRSLSANIAIELPEAELHSSHYRVLFLAALVLFMLTFVFNTLADLVRQRLRYHYGRL